MRIDRDEMFLIIAYITSKRSTCARIQTGAVITVDNVIVALGYNGTPSGFIHCENVFKDYNKELEDFKKSHHEFSLKYELHAEMNAISYAAKKGISLEHGTIYTLYSPCNFCAKAIIQSGIKRVVYNKKYTREDTDEFLKNNGIVVDFLSIDIKELVKNRLL